jgi:hypothetical protein
MGQWKQLSAIANLSKKAAKGRLYFQLDLRAQLAAGMRELAADAIEAFCSLLSDP